MTHPNSPFAALRAAATKCLRALGAVDPQQLESVDLHLKDGRVVPIPFAFPRPVLNDTESEIVAALEKAGKPLNQKEIADAADISLRSVERYMRGLLEREIVARHPSLGYYLPTAFDEES